MKKDPNHSHFPLKRCLVATLALIIIGAMVLTLIYSVVYSTGNQSVGRMIFIITGAILGALLVGYWVYQLVMYLVKRKDEN
ncbi:MAG: hypothetical protein LKM30_02450 [Bacilli bacterium]|jgi:uncharacterized membrane protein required for colicin V production|nr:hypothetical protein [Bacilli bacterium]